MGADKSKGTIKKKKFQDSQKFNNNKKKPESFNNKPKKKKKTKYLMLSLLSGVDDNDVVLEAEDEASTFDYRTLCLAQTCFEWNPSLTNKQAHERFFTKILGLLRDYKRLPLQNVFYFIIIYTTI